MRRGYAQDAVLVMDETADIRAPGGAVTVALCGSWDHEGRCPLAPHHTSVERDGPRVGVRVLFAAEEELEQTVRRRIVAALSSGRLTGPDGTTTRWRLADTRADGPLASERPTLERLARDG